MNGVPQSADENEAPSFDPTLPVLAAPVGGRLDASLARQNQRYRRALILAAIRRLLMEGGIRNVTMRRTAQLSGHVVQTVYNLVGPRDVAVIEAISDYTQYVGSLAPMQVEDPAAIIRAAELQCRSVVAAPDFTRSVCRISLTASRHIFLAYRERQIRGIHALLVRQKRMGIFRRDVDCHGLARNLMGLSGSIFVDWADGAVPDRELFPRMRSAYAQLLAAAISPRFGGLVTMPL